MRSDEAGMEIEYEHVVLFRGVRGFPDVVFARGEHILPLADVRLGF